MWKIAHHVWLTALILLLSLSVGWAQQTSTQQEPSSQRPSDTRTSPPATPLPPLSASPRTGQSSEASQDDGQSQSSSEPARRTLSGAEQYTLETMGQSHNYFIPIFQVTQSADTNGTNQYGGSTLESFTSVNGSFSLKHVWSHYNFVANYSGSGFLYNKDISSSSSAHAFNLSQTINGSRSSLLLSDAVSYLPESAFGYSRFAGSGSFGGGLGGLYNVSTSGLNGQYIPNQSILTGDSSRISNSAVAQYEYDLSPLSSLTFTGSYGMLRFPSSNFIDSDSGIFSAGYNHVIGRRNTIAVSYVGTIFRYDQPGSGNFINNTVALIYGHQISHLFALRLGGGPQYNTFGSGASGKREVRR